MLPAAKLLLFPGMGADHRLLGPQARAFPDLVVPPWIPPRRGESLASYAGRLAPTIPADASSVIGGVSFGGMLACELARILRPRALVLIASASDPFFMSRYQRTAATVGPHAPSAVLRPLARWPWLVRHFLPTRDPGHAQLLVDMLGCCDVGFLKWSAGAIVSWRPEPFPADIPVHRLHGDRDNIIPLRRYEGQTVVRDAGHLVNLTQPEETNAFLRGVVAMDER